MGISETSLKQKVADMQFSEIKWDKAQVEEKGVMSTRSKRKLMKVRKWSDLSKQEINKLEYTQHEIRVGEWK